jgi:glucose-6-phosphate 1-dehydrogenase
VSAQFIAVPAFDLIVFGGTGDLAMRKILPGLYHRHCDGQLPPESRIIGTARSTLNRDAFVARVCEALHQFVAAGDLDPARVDSYLRRIDYVSPLMPAGRRWPRCSLPPQIACACSIWQRRPICSGRSAGVSPAAAC